MENVLKNDWGPLLAPEFEKEYYRKLAGFFERRVQYTCCLPKERRYF